METQTERKTNVKTDNLEEANTSKQERQSKNIRCHGSAKHRRNQESHTQKHIESDAKKIKIAQQDQTASGENLSARNLSRSTHCSTNNSEESARGL